MLNSCTIIRSSSMLALFSFALDGTSNNPELGWLADTNASPCRSVGGGLVMVITMGLGVLAMIKGCVAVVFDVAGMVWVWVRCCCADGGGVMLLGGMDAGDESRIVDLWSSWEEGARDWLSMSFSMVLS
jgi:hypothetical protein